MLAALGVMFMAYAFPNDGVSFREAVRAQGTIVTFGEVADLSTLPTDIRRLAEAVPIAILPTNGGSVTVSSTEVFRRAHRGLPALMSWAGPAPEVAIQITYAPIIRDDQTDLETACAVTLKAVDAGQALSALNVRIQTCSSVEDLAPVQMGGRPAIARASSAFPAGAALAWPEGIDLPALAPGDEIIAESRVGPVTVQRVLKVAAPALEGEPVLARLPEGELVVVSQEIAP